MASQTLPTPTALPRLSPRNPALNADLEASGLAGAAAEIDALGYTVLPPQAAELAADLGDRLNELLPAAAERRRSMLLAEGPPFEEAVTLTPVLRLAEYVCGLGMILSQVSGFYAKTDGDGRNGELQSDYYLVREPFPPYGLRASAYFAVDGMSVDGGALWIVPGSHRYGRHPLQPIRQSMEDTTGSVRMLHTPAGDLEPPVPVICPPSSIVVVHGAAWSSIIGPSDTTARVLRCEYNRMFLRPFDDYEDLAEQFAGRNDKTLSNLLGGADAFGDNKHSGTDYPKLANSRKHFRT